MGRRYWIQFGSLVFSSFVATCMFGWQSAFANDECNVRHISNMVKTISILRQVENSINFLALSQVDAIADIATGVHTLELYNDPSGFMGL